KGKFETRTNESGFYGLTGLHPGTYTLSVEAPGFKTEITSAMELQVQQRATMDFTLEIGPVTEQVTVTSTAPLLNVGDSSLGQVVATRSIMELPFERPQLPTTRLAGGGRRSGCKSTVGRQHIGTRVQRLALHDEQLLVGRCGQQLPDSEPPIRRR